MAEILFTDNASSPNPPASNQVSLYAKTDGNLYSQNPAGVERLVTAGSAITQLTGDITATGPGTTVATISNNVVTNSMLVNEPAYTLLGNNTGTSTSPSYLSTIILGAPGYTDIGTGFQITGNTNGYFQSVIQNVNAGASASTDFIVSNNEGTVSTYYGDLGINSSNFSGAGSLNLANATYLYSQNGDLVLGTATANAIHVVVNGSSTDSITINSSGGIILPGLTGYLYANNSSGPVTVSSVIPIINGGTGQTTAAAAYNALSPMTTTGDIEYEISTGTAARLPIGTTGQVLTVSGGLPIWSTVSPLGAALTFFGDGSDGNVTIAGSVTLSRDMFYNNLTISSTAALNTNGYRIFVAGILNLTSAPAGSIFANGNVGVQGTGSPGAGGTAASGNSVGGSQAGSSGGAQNNSGPASPGVNIPALTNQTGGAGGIGGASGAGTTGAGGAAGTVGTSTRFYIRRWETNPLLGATLLVGGQGGSGSGGSGYGSGGNGTGGSGGGSGGGIVWISANTINRSSATVPSAIQANGGAGAAGYNGGGTAGGTGGGGGGGGGWIYLAYSALTGSTGTNILSANGGSGGTGASSADGTGGGGGSSGAGGVIELLNLTTNTITLTSGSGSVAGSPASGGTGGAGASTNIFQASL
jgi:hypothetical protein